MSSPSRPGLPAGDEEFDPHAVAVRDAATVMLVRDGARGPRGVHAAAHAQGRLRRRACTSSPAARSTTPTARPTSRPCATASPTPRPAAPRGAGRRPGLLGRRHPRVLRGGRRAAGPPARRRVRPLRRPEVEPRYRAHRRPSTTAAAAGRAVRRRGPAPGHRRHPLRQPLDHADRRAPSLRHPLLRRRAPRRPRSRSTTTTRPSPASGSAPPTPCARQERGELAMIPPTMKQPRAAGPARHRRRRAGGHGLARPPAGHPTQAAPRRRRPGRGR